MPGNRMLVPAVAALLAVNAVAAQGPVVPPPQSPPAQPALKAAEHPVVVSGCVRGTRLTRTGRTAESTVADVLNASEFVLEGPRELMQQIRKEHDGHYDEVTGIAILPPSRNDGSSVVGTKKVGPGQVSIGARREAGQQLEAPAPVRIRVSSFRHVDEACAGRG